MAALVIIAVLLLVVVIAVFYLGTLFGSKQVSRRCNRLTTIDGNMPDITAAGSFHEFLVKLHTKYGHVATFWYGKTHFVSLASAKAFKDTNKLFDRPAVLFEFMKPLIGAESIQYASGEDGKRRRHDYDQLFSYDAIKNYYNKFQKTTDAVAAKIESLSSDEHVNITEHMSLLVLKSLSHATYGDFFKDDEKAITMLRHYESAMAILNQDISKNTEAGQRFAQERFLPENASTRHPFSFQPFGFAGKRKCPGYRIAYAQGAVFLATLCRKFKFQMVEGQTVERKYGFVTIPSNDIWVTVAKRD
ncbi:cytochrome P450 20A1-like [Saccoglossus kowalevskii]